MRRAKQMPNTRSITSKAQSYHLSAVGVDVSRRPPGGVGFAAYHLSNTATPATQATAVSAAVPLYRRKLLRSIAHNGLSTDRANGTTNKRGTRACGPLPFLSERKTHLSEISDDPALGLNTWMPSWAAADAKITPARAVTAPMRTIVPRTRGRSDAKNSGAGLQAGVGVGRGAEVCACCLWSGMSGMWRVWLGCARACGLTVLNFG